jgi:membrane-associated phospholipid phosphatase
MPTRSAMALRALRGLGMCAAASFIAWAFSYLLPRVEGFDRALLLALNPDRPLPLLDAVVIFVTDFSLPFAALMLVVAGLGAELLLRDWVSARRLALGCRVAGLGVAIGVFVRFEAIYAHRAVPYAIVLATLLGFAWVGSALGRIEQGERLQIRRIFVATLLSIAVAQFALAQVAEHGLRRARPLAKANAGWNSAVRVVPDEVVSGGVSFPSGHAVSIFALLTPLFLLTPRPALRRTALALATACAASRVYVAAHFPTDVVASALFGVALASAVVYAFGFTRAPDTPRPSKPASLP